MFSATNGCHSREGQILVSIDRPSDTNSLAAAGDKGANGQCYECGKHQEEGYCSAERPVVSGLELPLDDVADENGIGTTEQDRT